MRTRTCEGVVVVVVVVGMRETEGDSEGALPVVA